MLLSELLEDDSPAAQQAKQMGLISKGWGRWADSTGKVTHYTKDGQLRKVGSGELDQPAMKRRPKRPHPNRGREVPNKIPQAAKEQPQQVPVKQRPTKEDPSFDELSSAAKKHTYTVTKSEACPIASNQKLNGNHKVSGLVLKTHGLIGQKAKLLTGKATTYIQLRLTKANVWSLKMNNSF
jgi:hypothetical protein